MLFILVNKEINIKEYYIQFKKTVFIGFITLLGSMFYGQQTPNFLWLVCEDQHLFFSPYGDYNAATPNIENLANEGTVYENCFTTSPVCSPSRSSIITGMYPSSIGTQNMRAYKKNNTKKINPHNQLPYYSPVPKESFQFFTEILRLNGYYCSNNSKEDYNMAVSPLAWDESSNKAHWRNRKDKQPFFSVFNFNITHESNVWSNKSSYSSKEKETIFLPEIFPNHDAIKHDFLTNYLNIEKLDQKIGKIIDQLKEDGLYDNTIIFFFSDHGGPFPRYKRAIYDTGIHCPLIIKWPKSMIKGRNNQLISFVDFAPTVLDIVHLQNDYPMDGVSFYKKDQRNFIYAATDRFDESVDKRRCVRTKKYKLIVNLDTNSSIAKPIKYRKQMKTMEVLDSLKSINTLNGYFDFWYNTTKPPFELYNIQEDPLEINNLYKDPCCKNSFIELKEKLFTWMESSDFGEITEEEMVNVMFPNSFEPQILKLPSIAIKDQGILIHPNNNDVSVGWKDKGAKTWKVYKAGEVFYPKENFEVLLFKPGYKTTIKSFNL